MRVRTCACMLACDCHWFAAHFLGWQELVREKQWSVCRFWQGAGRVGSSDVGGSPHPPLSNAAAGGRVCPLSTPLPWTLLTLITPSLAQFTGGFPGRRRLPLPKPPAAHFLSGLAGPWWNRSLWLLHSLHNLVLEVDLSPLEIRRIKAAFKSRSGY